MGFRFALHRKDLPGKPDIVMPKYRAALFVHGCFWHQHECRLFQMPATRPEFWRSKFARNRTNDEVKQRLLLHEGWRVAVIWECALRDRDDGEIAEVISSTVRWLESKRRQLQITGSATARECRL